MKDMQLLSRSRRALAGDMSSQRGVTLLVALVVLLVMTITGLALVRTSSLGAGVSGSLALKQSATSGADLGLETGLAQLDVIYRTGPDQLGVDNAASGYYASVDPKLAAKDMPWSTAPVAPSSNVGGIGNVSDVGNEVHYLIHRLCRQTGAVNITGQQCVMPQGAGCPGSTESLGSVPALQSTADVPDHCSGQIARDTMSYVQMSVY